MLFSSIVGGAPSASMPSPDDDFWYSPVVQTTSGIRVTPTTALKASACFAAVNILAESIASIPFTIYQRVDDRKIEKRREHPLQDIIDAEPNDLQTAFEFWHMQVAFGALYGVSYAEIMPGSRGAVDQLMPLRPDRVKTEQLVNGRLRYRYDDPLTGKERVLVQDEVWRIPGFSFDGVLGIAPIVFGNDSIALSLATEAFGAKFFKNDATPSVVLEHPKALKPVAVNNIRQSWLQQHAGIDNAHSVAVLEEGMQVRPIGVNNKDSQFIEARRYQISEIARLFRIPPHMLYDLEKSSFNNIEQQSIEFVKYTIRPHIRKIEQRIRKDLIIEKGKFFARADLDDLLRGEIEPRYTAYGSAIQNGWMTRNEAREKEDMNPIAGLDDPLHQVNMTADAEDQKTQDNKENNGAEAQAFKRMAIDATSRIVASELTNLQSLSAKDKDIAAYYDAKLKPFIVKTLNPLYDASVILGIGMREPATVADDYLSNRLGLLQAAGDDFDALYAEWSAATSLANLENFNLQGA
jgi:HK97 family phage portal protein